MMIKTSVAQPVLLLMTVLWLICAAMLHVLADLSLGPTRLRFGASDLLLPILLAPVVIDMWKFKGFYRLRAQNIYFWLMLATFWLLVSLIIGRWRMGEWQSWALLNKTVGWGVLLGYFFAGCWLARQSRKIREGFLRVFFLTGWFIGEYSLIKQTLFLNRIIEGYEYVRIEGMFANPNAFGIAMAVLFVLQVPFFYRKKLFPLWVHTFGMAIALSCVVMSGSRSAMLGLLIAIPFIIWMRMINFNLIIRVIIVLTLFLSFHHMIPGTANFIYSLQYNKSEQNQDNKINTEKRIVISEARDVYNFHSNTGGINHRIVLTRRAIQQWQEYPLTGVGLGMFYWTQLKGKVELPALIHTSALWILTEMGVIGVVIFVGLLFVVMKALWQGSRTYEDDPLLIGALFMLIVLIGASVGTETLYQRYMWLILGLVLCYRDPQNQPDS